MVKIFTYQSKNLNIWEVEISIKQKIMIKNKKGWKAEIKKKKTWIGHINKYIYIYIVQINLTCMVWICLYPGQVDGQDGCKVSLEKKTILPTPVEDFVTVHCFYKNKGYYTIL